VLRNKAHTEFIKRVTHLFSSWVGVWLVGVVLVISASLSSAWLMVARLWTPTAELLALDVSFFNIRGGAPPPDDRPAADDCGDIFNTQRPMIEHGHLVLKTSCSIYSHKVLITCDLIALTCACSKYNFFHFYARQHICYSAYMLSPVRLSVRLSDGYLIQKRLKLGSWNFHHTVASSL